MRDLLVYTVLRLGVFALLWWLLTLAGLHYLVAGVLAALLAMLISFVALNRQRDRVAMRWKAADDRRRARRGEVRDEDADEEDALLEGADDVEDDHAAGASEDEPRQHQD